MDLPRDFEELLAAFDDEGVRYVLVGGYGVRLHSRPRWPKDIDLWIDGGDNLLRVARGLGVGYEHHRRDPGRGDVMEQARE